MTADPIADMLTRVRNAIQARHAKADVPASRLKTEIARILKEEGYIDSVISVDGEVQGVISMTLSGTRSNAK